MPKLPEGVVLAVIAASSAIAGTMVGAIVTYEGNRALQDRLTHQEEARQVTAARAVARLLRAEYHTDADLLEEMRILGEYDPESYRQRKFVSHIGQEDRKLLAGRLSARDWEDVAEASQAVEAIDGDLEAHHGRGPVGAGEMEEVDRALAVCHTAFTALEPLADGRTNS